MAKQSRNSNFRRRLASDVMKCGSHKVWFNPDALTKIDQAITRADIRKLMSSGSIKRKKDNVKKKIKVSGKQRKGSRKGSKGARIGKKTNWLKIVRPQRRLIKEMKDTGTLVEGAYRKLYVMVKSGVFRSKAHLRTFVEDKKMAKDEEKN
jgi:large subunit ribosomal protein L19e